MSTGDGGDEEYDPYDDVPEWTEEDEERYQARQDEERRRKKIRRRQAASFALLVLLVLGAGVGGAGINQGWWEWPWRTEAPTDAVRSPTTCATLPQTVAAPAAVRVSVLNATDRSGLAAAVGDELERRGYVVVQVGNDRSGTSVTGAAQLRYGPALSAQAQSLALHIPGAVLVDDGRVSDVVDLALGPGYNRMVPAAEAAAAVAAGTPPPQPGCGSGTAPTTSPTTAPTTAPSTTG